MSSAAVKNTVWDLVQHIPIRISNFHIVHCWYTV